ncbi:MAG: cytochrome c3 family protein [Thermodesulfobacteriota bacterium]|jgi:hypothetical protein
MQKKALNLIQLLVFILSLVLAGGMSIAGDKETASDTGPDEIILKTAAAIKSAKFPHKKHQEAFECGECHHSKSDDNIKYPYVDGMEIKKCVVCHNKDDMNNPKLNNFKLIAHALCKECHKRNKDKAPTKCSGCHIK